ncbi:unnamed protein product [Bursaphelenchus okinawaensis]|uniref:Uncharacterized protein n=1 Tax=Bursaphelenchus okinawaensis TaxID=465554 RepID=A0A811K1V7_9BILA|nr:unnamed protein product [Bursaphelenchus okinawaensis]CAG9090057.1 unnamed protein product [Bursaphelenchus okinawaensis]
MSVVNGAFQLGVDAPSFTSTCMHEVIWIYLVVYLGATLLASVIYIIIGSLWVSVPMFPSLEYVSNYQWCIRRIFYELQDGKEPLIDEYTDMNQIAIEMLNQNRFVCSPPAKQSNSFMGSVGYSPRGFKEKQQ